jgi:hypothetical protein
VIDHRRDSYHTTVVYNDPDLGADPWGDVTKPVWAPAPERPFASHGQEIRDLEPDHGVVGQAHNARNSIQSKPLTIEI